MYDIEEEMYDWLKDYIPNGELDGLSVILAAEARKYAKGRFVAGLFVGAFLTAILLKWLS